MNPNFTSSAVATGVHFPLRHHVVDWICDGQKNITRLTCFQLWRFKDTNLREGVQGNLVDLERKQMLLPNKADRAREIVGFGAPRRPGEGAPQWRGGGGWAVSFLRGLFSQDLAGDDDGASGERGGTTRVLETVVAAVLLVLCFGDVSKHWGQKWVSTVVEIQSWHRATLQCLQSTSRGLASGGSGSAKP